MKNIYRIYGYSNNITDISLIFKLFYSSKKEKLSSFIYYSKDSPEMWKICIETTSFASAEAKIKRLLNKNKLNKLNRLELKMDNRQYDDYFYNDSLEYDEIFNLMNYKEIDKYYLLAEDEQLKFLDEVEQRILKEREDYFDYLNNLEQEDVI